MIEITTESEAQTIALGSALARTLHGGDVLALVGPLGAGKTRLVKGLVRGLGLDERAVSSPTFVLCHEYRSAAQEREREITLVHIDAYRMHGVEELDTIGWDELLDDPTAIMVVEWADRIEEALPAGHVRIEFEHTGETQRRMVIDDRSGAAPRFDDLVNRALRTPSHHCPVCGTTVAQDADTMPFCSKRCRMVDLGRWFSGKHVISRPIEEDDLFNEQ